MRQSWVSLQVAGAYLTTPCRRRLVRLAFRFVFFWSYIDGRQRVGQLQALLAAPDVGVNKIPWRIATLRAGQFATTSPSGEPTQIFLLSRCHWLIRIWFLGGAPAVDKAERRPIFLPQRQLLRFRHPQIRRRRFPDRAHILRVLHMIASMLTHDFLDRINSIIIIIRNTAGA